MMGKVRDDSQHPLAVLRHKKFSCMHQSFHATGCFAIVLQTCAIWQSQALWSNMPLRDVKVLFITCISLLSMLKQIPYLRGTSKGEWPQYYRARKC